MRRKAVTIAAIGAILVTGCAGIPSPVTNLHSASALSRRPRCDAQAEIATFEQRMRLSKPPLTAWERNSGALSTPFKYLSSEIHGPSAWTDTGCIASGIGTPCWPTQHSSDDLYTIDVALKSAKVNGIPVTARFVRLEVRPSWPAHDSVRLHRPQPGELIEFSGPLIRDGDVRPGFGQGHVEIHPVEPIEVLGSVDRRRDCPTP